VTDRPLTDRDYRALARFRHALRVFLRFSEEAARAEGLTPAQHQLLLAIRGHPGAPSVLDLAEVLQTRSNSVVGLLDRAEAAGLTESSADPADGRRRLVSLTPEGAAVLERLSGRHRAELRTFRDEMADVLHELD
jgi:DNA-binding MarR family transcriptional regulator